MHGGFGLINGFNNAVLGDFSMFDMGLGVWCSVSVTHENYFPYEIRRHMHTMTAAGNHAAGG
jgi:hypothetical protein